MLLPDPRVLLALSGLACLFMAPVLFFMHRSYSASIRGLREWTAAPVLFFVGTMFLSLRGFLPDSINSTLTNLLLLGSSILYYIGSLRFFGHRPKLWPWVALCIVSTLGLLWSNYVTPHQDPVRVISNSASACVFIAHSILYLRQGTPTFAGRFMLGVLATKGVLLILRIISVSVDMMGLPLVDPRVSLLVYVTAYSLLTFLLTIAVILMTTDAVCAEFERLAAVDAMTGALSRTALLEASTQELERCKRHDRAMSLLLIDLDHFKAINDTHGHLTGDQVLTDFVQRTKAQLRTLDRIGRYGGEEFVVLLPETNMQSAAIVAERIRAQVEKPKQSLPHYTVSIGIASNEESHADDSIDNMINRADRAMYYAKASGRNRIQGLDI